MDGVDPGFLKVGSTSMWIHRSNCWMLPALTMAGPELAAWRPPSYSRGSQEEAAVTINKGALWKLWKFLSPSVFEIIDAVNRTVGSRIPHFIPFEEATRG